MTLDIGAALFAVPFIAAHQARKPAVRMAAASLCCILIGVVAYFGRIMGAAEPRSSRSRSRLERRGRGGRA